MEQWKTTPFQKMHILDTVKAGGYFFIEDNCFQEYGHLLQGKATKKYGYSSKCDVWTDLHSILSGKNEKCLLPQMYQGKRSHDVENLMAAYALCTSLGVTPAQFQKAVATFKKPAHRIEFVRDLNGITYIDDSKGTNIDAVIRAVETMSGDVIFIAGGVDKGAAYTPWIFSFYKKVKSICAIGQAAPKIQKICRMRSLYSYVKTYSMLSSLRPAWPKKEMLSCYLLVVQVLICFEITPTEVKSSNALLTLFAFKEKITHDTKRYDHRCCISQRSPISNFIYDGHQF